LAPSEPLVKAALGSRDAKSWRRFVQRYRGEMKRPEARHLLDLLAALSKAGDFSVGCYCADEARCHRSVLRELLREHGAVLGGALSGRGRLRQNAGRMTRPQRAPKRAKTKATNGPPPRRAGRRVDYETVRKLVLALPEVEEGLCYGTPGMRVAGRFLSRLKEDGDTLVLRLGFDERPALLASN